MSDGTRSELTEAIERNWVLPIGLTNPQNYTVTLRLHLSAEGAVTRIEVLDDKDDPTFGTLVESARRAVLITLQELGKLPIPADELTPTITLRWPMKEICEQRGGC